MDKAGNTEQIQKDYRLTPKQMPSTFGQFQAAMSDCIMTSRIVIKKTQIKARTTAEELAYCTDARNIKWSS